MTAHEDRAGHVRRRPAWPAGTEAVAVSALRPYARNARTHSRRQIKKIACPFRILDSDQRMMQPAEVRNGLDSAVSLDRSSEWSVFA